LDPTDGHKIESLRFRSTAFAPGTGPKRAAYAKKELMEETTSSTHAYVVFTTQAAAKQAFKSLNGSVVLDRHLRTDLVADPAKIDHRRCVFVGNLGFVDDETIETETGIEAKERKKRGKQAADAEEGLWRTFSKAGKIESVRVIRDKATRVGKGIAYVQFHDENSVEASLLFNDKKFPHMLPRKLRVTRAKKPKTVSKHGVTAGISGSHEMMQLAMSEKVPTINSYKNTPFRRSDFVFEGHRATNPAAHRADHKHQRQKNRSKPSTRSSRRGATFKAARGKQHRN
jgi:nucleolar protein 12